MDILTLADALASVGAEHRGGQDTGLGEQPDIPPPPRHVACGSCRACCHLAVFLRPEEDRYDTQPGTRILRRREADGACLYLDPERGYTIYDRRPVACRAFACADFVRHSYGNGRPWPTSIRPSNCPTAPGGSSSSSTTSAPIIERIERLADSRRARESKEADRLAEEAEEQACTVFEPSITDVRAR